MCHWLLQLLRCIYVTSGITFQSTPLFQLRPNAYFEYDIYYYLLFSNFVQELYSICDHVTCDALVWGLITVMGDLFKHSDVCSIYLYLCMESFSLLVRCFFLLSEERPRFLIYFRQKFRVHVGIALSILANVLIWGQHIPSNWWQFLIKVISHGLSPRMQKKNM